MKIQKGISTGVGVIVLLAVAALAFGGTFAYEYFAKSQIPNPNDQQNSNIQNQNTNNNTQPTACTMEAKICPDGSSVGRSGPNCEFTDCPDQTAAKELSDALIINAINKLNGIQLEKNAQGKYEASMPEIQGGYNINLITKGDLNGDGFQDAFVWSTVCGASCGSVFTAVINKKDSTVSAFNVVPEGFVMSSAAQYSVKIINIDSGIIKIKAVVPQFDGTTVDQDLNYKLVGNNLVKN